MSETAIKETTRSKKPIMLKTVPFLFKWAWENSKSYFPVIILNTFFSAIYSYLIVISPQFILTMYEASEIDTQQMFLFFGAMIISAIGVSACKAIYTPLASTLRYKLIHTIMKQSLSIPYKDFEDPKTQDRTWTAYRSVNSVDGVQGFYTNTGLLSEYAGVFLVSLYMLLQLQVSLAAFILLWIVLFVKIYLTGSTKKEALLREQNVLFREQWYLRDIVTDYSYTKELKVFNLKSWLKQKIHLSNQQLNDVNSKAESIIFHTSLKESVLHFIRDATIFVMLVWVYFEGELSLGEFATFNIIILQLNQALNRALTSVKKILDKHENYIEMVTYLDQESYSKLSTEKAKSIEGNWKIEFKNVSFKYPGSDRYVLENVNCVIRKGEKIGIVGLNGTGKSTFLKLLLGLFNPSEGEVLLNNVDVKSIKDSEYFSYFSPIFQDIHIFPYSIEENIKFDYQGDSDSIKNVIKRSGLNKKYYENIEQVLTKYIEKDGLVPSGGETQKLALARADFFNRPIMILDEPTSALDAEAEENFYQKINNEFKEKTVLFVSHRLASTKFCSKIILLKNNTIFEEGTHEELYKKKGSYYDMYKIQASHYEAEGI